MKQDRLIIIGKWNTKVENKADSNVIRKFGVGIKNEVDQFLDFSEANDLSFANTYFKHLNRQMYSWKSADGKYRIQMAYIIGNRRCISNILSAKIWQEVDCATDHKL